MEAGLSDMLEKSNMDDLSPLLIGHHDSKRQVDLSAEIVQKTHASNFDMLTFPITSNHFQSRVLTLLSSAFSAGGDKLNAEGGRSIVVEPLAPIDTPLSPDDSISQVVGVTSPWIDLASPDPVIADVSRQVLKLELTYAAFCGVTYVVIPGPKNREGADNAAYARAVLDGLNQGLYIQFYIWLDMFDDPENDREVIGDLSSFARKQFLSSSAAEDRTPNAFGTWEIWDTIRTVCKYSPRLSVALRIPDEMPPMAVQSRWYSEPVRVLTVDAAAFSGSGKEKKMSMEHEEFILRVARLKTAPWFLLCDLGTIEAAIIPPGDVTNGEFPPLEETKVKEKASTSDPNPELTYLRGIQGKQLSKSAQEAFGAGYQDYMQQPLQPLSMNLESMTYEVFEKDPVKYEWYEKAVARALHDWVESGKPASNPDGRVVVAVVGAGRGPLVSRALKAAEDVGVEIDMWALEKNPNAFVLLQRHNKTRWDGKVTLVKSDMRTWQGPSREGSPYTIRKTYNTESDDEGPDDKTASKEEDEDDKSKADEDIESKDEVESIDLKTPLEKTVILPKDDDSGDEFTDTMSYKIDILISELLGSFADNELSPECLDGVQHLLNPTHGISIPESYTAHLTPIAAPKLHADISLSMVNVNPNAASIPYVVMLDAIDHLSTNDGQTTSGAGGFFTQLLSPSPNKPSGPTKADSKGTAGDAPQPVVETAWSFQHPNPSIAKSSTSNAHNARYARLTFPVPNQGSCHGLAGYFETVLYKGVELSTNPLTMDAKSKDMISWFPIFFPFKTPLSVPAASEIEVCMWRMTDDRQVWYEWMAAVWAKIGGKKVKVGATELHSSEKEACLM